MAKTGQHFVGNEGPVDECGGSDIATALSVVTLVVDFEARTPRLTEL